MILGRDKHIASACFDELDYAVRSLTSRVICFNAHAYPAPPGAIIYNTEDIGVPANGGTVVDDPRARWAGHEVWDAVEANAAKHGATYVPIGYHPSMSRFMPLPPEAQDIDVLLYGCMNERRSKLLDGLAARGLNVVAMPRLYGHERDAVLARAKVVLNVAFNPEGSWPTHRAAHLVSNSVFMLGEAMPDAWPFAITRPYDEIVESAVFWVRSPQARTEYAARILEEFKKMPLTLPAEKPVYARDQFFDGYVPPPADPWAMLRTTTADQWDIDAMYTAHRKEPVSDGPRVLMIVPSYRESIEIQQLTDPSREAVQADLAAHGIGSGRASIYGDSLVARMRQRGVNQFMKSRATHLLWCDLDIEPLDPTCVREMLATGHDVIAGACPFKNTDRKVVCNLLPGALDAMQESGTLEAPDGCIEVQDAGTGFMLVSRKAIVALMQAHPELLHFSGGKSDHGEPLWAIYDTGVVDGVYRSEDYMFCHLWRQLGGKVYVHLASTFRHYGTHGFEASIMEQLGLSSAKACDPVEVGATTMARG